MSEKHQCETEQPVMCTCEEAQDQEIECDHEAMKTGDTAGSREQIFDNSPLKYCQSQLFITDCKRILGFLGIYDPFTAEDITGDIRVKILEKCPENHKVDSLKAYVKMMIKNHLIDKARRNNAIRRKHSEVDIDAQTVETLQAVFGSARSARISFEVNEWRKTLSVRDLKIMDVWEEQDFKNDAAVVRKLNELGVTVKFTTYKFNQWKEAMRESASWYVRL